MADNIAGAPDNLSREALGAQDDAPTIIEARSQGWEPEELTAEELAYFNSRGNDTSGLKIPSEPAYTPEPTPAPAPTPTPEPRAPEVRAPVTPDSAPLVPTLEPAPTPAPNAESVGADEDVDLDTLTVDSQGVMRDDKGRFVPHSALHRAREKFKAERARAETATSELQQLRQTVATMEGRFAALMDLQKTAPATVTTEPTPAAEPEDTPPDPQTDIFGYVAWQGRQIQKLSETIAQTQQKAEQKVEEVRGQVTEQNMMTHYKNDAQAFVAQKPEFVKAYRHLIDARNMELTLMGYEDPGQRMEIINSEEKELVRKAYERKQRPAEFIYNVSVARGFRAPAPAQTPTTAAPTPAPAPAPAPAPTPAPAPAPATATPAAINGAQHLANLAAAKAAAVTLSGAGGASGDGLTMEAVANMSEAEFEALQAKMGGRKAMRQFLGG